MDNANNEPEEDYERTLGEIEGHKILPAQPVSKQFFPTKRSAIEVHKLNEITRLIFIPKDVGETERNARILRALELYENLTPGDGVEGMLATQMVGTHHAALECLRRAALPSQTVKEHDMALRHAQRLMSLFERQMAALDKHRGKGQQKVTVEHVNVHSGGQAIVGSVDTSSRQDRPTKVTAQQQPEKEDYQAVDATPSHPRKKP